MLCEKRRTSSEKLVVTKRGIRGKGALRVSGLKSIERGI